MNNDQWLVDCLERLESGERRLSVLEENMRRDCEIALGKTSAQPATVEQARERVNQWLCTMHQGRLP